MRDKLNDTNEAQYTPPLPCRCCHVVCNETTGYLCIVIEPDGTDCEDCEFVGDYCGPEDIVTPPDDWVDPDDDDGGITVGGGEEIPPGGEGDDGGTTTGGEDDGIAPTCGDGAVTGGEQCDHGNSVTIRCDGGNVCYNCQCVPPGTVPEDEEPPEYQHLECQNEACVLVDGYGYDECVTHEDCEEEEEVECGDGDVEGWEECETNGDCPEGMECYECMCFEEEPENECGDTIVEGWEECEFDQDCGSGEICLGCLCYDVPSYCGDGVVDSGEDCDPDASPTGCSDGEVCSAGCTCVGPPELNCDEICSTTPGAQNFGGGYASEQARRSREFLLRKQDMLPCVQVLMVVCGAQHSRHLKLLLRYEEGIPML